MSGSLTPKLRKLPAAQQALWRQLSPLVGLGMVLHGGTAIALRLGHRVSVDFDFFSRQALDRRLLARALPVLGSATTLQDEPNSWTLLVPVSGIEVKVSFFGEIALGPLAEPTLTNDGVALVASLPDLFAQKLKVVMQRVEAKDYLDIAAMLRAGQRLRDGMNGAMTLFGIQFSPMDCAKALVYFKGGDLTSVPVRDRETLLRAVRLLPKQLEDRPSRAGDATGDKTEDFNRDGGMSKKKRES